MSLIDITRSLSPETAVWPGDRSVEWSWTAQIEEGSAVNVGGYASSTHAGTHADAPRHVADDGASVDDLPLSSFVGPAEVVDVAGAERIRPAHVANVQAPRVLFRTPVSSLPDSEWPEAFPVLDPETVRVLAAKNVVLVGVDTPSVDPVDSTDLPAHHALRRHGVVNLENLCLDGVAPGRYRLIALPIRLAGADAAPVRAVLDDDAQS
jgi:arylformamidase